MRNRVEVMHGVNLGELARRDPATYGGMTFTHLEKQIGDFARELGLVVQFFQTNHEGEYVEHLHRLDGLADGLILNPGGGRTTRGRFATRWSWPGCRRSRSTCPTWTRARSGAACP